MDADQSRYAERTVAEIEREQGITYAPMQRQAVALLMATMTPLKFLILDEHTAALDPKTAEVIMALTDRVIREKHLTAMMVTHNLRYAVEYGDRILMMNRGRVVLDRAGAEKRATSMDDILTMFNQISLETGN